jgi:hypothetical protein
MPAVQRFPRWRVFHRALARTTDDIASLWGAVLVALAFGFVGAFFVLPKDAGWGARFVAAVGIATLATVGVWGLLLAAHALWYRVSGGHDAAWRVGWSLYSKEPTPGFRMTATSVALLCDAEPPVSVSALGHVEAVVRLPSGAFLRMAQHGMGGDSHNLWFHATGSTAPPPPGTYEVRWYGTTARRKRYEITRSRFTVSDET